MSDGEILLRLGLWWLLFLAVAGIAIRIQSTSKTGTLSIIPNNQSYYTGVMAAGLALLYLFYLSPAVGTGDAAFYNTQIESGDLDGQYIHYGHYLLGRFVYLIFPVHIDLLMNLWAALLGIASVVLIYQIFLSLNQDHVVAFLCALGFGASAVAIYSFVYSEVYVTGLFLCVFAYWLLIKNQNLLAGLCFGLAVLVSILSIVFGPLFLYRLVSANRLRWPAILACALGTAIVVGPFSLFYLDGLLYGDRGLLTGAGATSSFIKMVSGWFASIKILIGSFSILAPLSFMALVALAVMHGVRKSLVLIPVLLAVVVHVLTAGALLEWGLDLLLTPLLFLPIIFLGKALKDSDTLAWSYPRFKTVLALAVLFNTASGLSVWSGTVLAWPKNMLQQYESLSEHFSEDELSILKPLGTFHEAGMFLRAHNRPYDIAAIYDDFHADKHGHTFIILNPDLYAELLSSLPEGWQIVEYEAANPVWLLRYSSALAASSTHE